MLVLYIILALLLKGSKDKLWVMINAIQVIVYMPLYAADFPATLQIFLNVFRKIAEGDVFDVKAILELVGLDGLLA